MSKQVKAGIVVSTARDCMSTAAMGSSFILTGNLLAPYLGAVTCDLLFSYYQRSKYQQLKARAQQQMTNMLDGLKQMAAARTQVRPIILTCTLAETFINRVSRMSYFCFENVLLIPHWLFIMLWSIVKVQRSELEAVSECSSVPVCCSDGLVACSSRSQSPILEV